MSEKTYTEIGMPLARLSTGRLIAVGIHSYASEVNEDGTQKSREFHSPMTDVEVDEAWTLVNARLAERRAEREGSRS